MRRGASHDSHFQGPCGPSCVLFKATVNKIRNIGVHPCAMHTAMASGQQGAVFTGSSLRITHMMIRWHWLEAAWV
ncbi:hypothetical protein PSPTOT1_0889 [Pseudomonas syringae pv. tomato T1]|nr:hypothetical protein PSPTOT1_0889 [Pseudomonas syringae pv. tomato T1]